MEDAKKNIRKQLRCQYEGHYEESLKDYEAFGVSFDLEVSLWGVIQSVITPGKVPGRGACGPRQRSLGGWLGL